MLLQIMSDMVLQGIQTVQWLAVCDQMPRDLSLDQCKSNWRNMRRTAPLRLWTDAEDELLMKTMRDVCEWARARLECARVPTTLYRQRSDCIRRFEELRALRMPFRGTEDAVLVPYMQRILTQPNYRPDWGNVARSHVVLHGRYDCELEERVRHLQFAQLTYNAQGAQDPWLNTAVQLSLHPEYISIAG